MFLDLIRLFNSGTVLLVGGGLGDDLSSKASRYQLKSPPIKILEVPSSGSNSKTVRKNLGSSELGPYIFSKVIGNELIWPEISINLPFESITLDLSKKGMLSRNRIALLLLWM